MSKEIKFTSEEVARLRQDLTDIRDLHFEYASNLRKPNRKEYLNPGINEAIDNIRDNAIGFLNSKEK